MKNTALGDVSRDKYSTRLRLVLYFSLNTPPCAIFFIDARRCFNNYTYDVAIYDSKNFQFQKGGRGIEKVTKHCSLMKKVHKLVKIKARLRIQKEMEQV